jgi:hypothetical protein
MPMSREGTEEMFPQTMIVEKREAVTSTSRQGARAAAGRGRSACFSTKKDVVRLGF